MGGRRYQLSSEVWERENLYIINEMPEKKSQDICPEPRTQAF